jgi:hypothetical protein
MFEATLVTKYAYYALAAGGKCCICGAETRHYGYDITSNDPAAMVYICDVCRHKTPLVINDGVVVKYEFAKNLRNSGIGSSYCLNERDLFADPNCTVRLNYHRHGGNHVIYQWLTTEKAAAVGEAVAEALKRAGLYSEDCEKAVYEKKQNQELSRTKTENAAKALFEASDFSMDYEFVAYNQELDWFKVQLKGTSAVFTLPMHDVTYKQAARIVEKDGYFLGYEHI